jgi:hypothetical protein
VARRAAAHSIAAAPAQVVQAAASICSSSITAARWARTKVPQARTPLGHQAAARPLQPTVAMLLTLLSQRARSSHARVQARLRRTLPTPTAARLLRLQPRTAGAGGPACPSHHAATAWELPQQEGRPVALEASPAMSARKGCPAQRQLPASKRC